MPEQMASLSPCLTLLAYNQWVESNRWAASQKKSSETVPLMEHNMLALSKTSLLYIVTGCLPWHEAKLTGLVLNVPSFAYAGETGQKESNFLHAA
mmetsp:Transcript_61027/g.108617  ORF Transcript_61027/g.108617 Transcript_61027/m.108617 type:complete len:95 (+) Transcript_61027:1601-1885(+)